MESFIADPDFLFEELVSVSEVKVLLNKCASDVLHQSIVLVPLV